MSQAVCPKCEMTDLLNNADRIECMTCGHEWPIEAEADTPDASG